MTSEIRSPSLLVRLLAVIAVVVAATGCTPAPTHPPATAVPLALAPIEVTPVGDVRQGTTTDAALVIRVTELAADSLPAGPGTFHLTLTDSAGTHDAVSFTGTPTVDGPGSLGATAVLSRNDVLTIEVFDTDPFNVEPLTIGGLRLRASATAPVGPITLTIGGCGGSLAGCAANDLLPSPGTVVAAP